MEPTKAQLVSFAERGENHKRSARFENVTVDDIFVMVWKGGGGGDRTGEESGLAEVPVKTGTPKPGKGGKGARDGLPGRDVGAALRKAFDATAKEDVPAELLDLLRRLD